MGARAYLAGAASATRALGEALGRVLRPGSLVLLVGGLGAGKTTFAQGLAAGMGVRDVVISPSFTLVREYDAAPGRPRFIHMDFYRLTGAAEVRELALTEFLAGDDVVAVEWPERAGGDLPDDALVVTLVVVGDARRITLEARGEAARAVLLALDPPMGMDAP